MQFFASTYNYIERNRERVNGVGDQIICQCWKNGFGKLEKKITAKQRYWSARNNTHRNENWICIVYAGYVLCQPYWSKRSIAYCHSKKATMSLWFELLLMRDQHEKWNHYYWNQRAINCYTTSKRLCFSSLTHSCWAIQLTGLNSVY